MDTSARLRALWDFDDPAASETRFRDLVEAAERDDETNLAHEARSQIARALGLQRRFDEAHAILDASVAARPASERARARLDLERGRVLRSSGRPEEARPYFDAAWSRARAAGEAALAIDAAHMIAIVAEAAEADEWHERALAEARASTDAEARRWVPSLLNNLGFGLLERGEAERALACFEEALEERIARDDDPATIRIAQWAIGRARRALGRHEEALALQRQLESTAGPDGPDGYVHEEIAECLDALGRRDEARPHFLRAAELLAADPWIAEHEPARIHDLRRRAEAEPT